MTARPERAAPVEKAGWRGGAVAAREATRYELAHGSSTRLRPSARSPPRMPVVPASKADRVERRRLGDRPKCPGLRRLRCGLPLPGSNPPVEL